MPNVFTVFTPNICLDEEFDAPDIVADHKLCCNMAAGRWGLHPDAWGSHDSLTTLPPRFRRFRPHEPPKPPVYKPFSIDTAWVAKYRHQPDQPVMPTRIWLETRPAGEVQLTCDQCEAARFSVTIEYRKGRRDAAVAAIRRQGAEYGWTCIADMDRCPRCSHAAAPEPVGNGAGADQRNK